MDQSVEDVCKEFSVFRTLAKMWLETKSMPDYTQYMLSCTYYAKVFIDGYLFPLQSLTLMIKNKLRYLHIVK